jgi:hypothetical protein
MNIYLMSQVLNDDYDTYDSVVVAAKSAEDARTIHPNPWVTHIKNNEWMGTYVNGGEYEKNSSEWVVFNDISEIKVKVIGKANASLERGVINSSFNAG